MKTALMLCALTTGTFAAQPILPRIEPQELAERQCAKPMAVLQTQAKAGGAVTHPADQSIIKQSVILHYGADWTLIPQGAVVFIPEKMKNRIIDKPTGTLIAFKDFLIKNRAWITTVEVSIDQATGAKPLPAKQAEFWSKHDKVVIAVHQNGPISMRVSKPAPTTPPT
jgi:hypothetical protein